MSRALRITDQNPRMETSRGSVTGRGLQTRKPRLTETRLWPRFPDGRVRGEHSAKESSTPLVVRTRALAARRPVFESWLYCLPWAPFLSISEHQFPRGATRGCFDSVAISQM